MRAQMRRAAASLLAFVCLSSCAHESARSPARTPDAREQPRAERPPRVVVTLVVDQLAAWIAAQRWPLLPPEGGFARLRREGTYAKEMRYAHAATDTAPGHAALYTGNTPRGSGIFGN